MNKKDISKMFPKFKKWLKENIKELKFLYRLMVKEVKDYFNNSFIDFSLEVYIENLPYTA